MWTSAGGAGVGGGRDRDLLKHGFPFFLGVGTVIRGWALAHQGKEEEGIAQILHGLDIYRTTGSGINWPQLLLSLAEAYELSGNAVEGLRAVDGGAGCGGKNRRATR